MRSSACCAALAHDPSTLLPGPPRTNAGAGRIMVSVLRLTFVRSGLCRAESRHDVDP